MEFKFVKIAVYVPVDYAQKMRDVLANNGAGQIGNYDSCSFSVKGTGRFRPLSGANPHIGSVGETEEVPEEKIEVICPIEKKESLLKAIKEAHPYEEPAIDVYPLLND